MVSRRVKRHASGGRIGQRHRKTPVGLCSYDVPPASSVKITRADGSTEVQPAVAVQRSKFELGVHPGNRVGGEVPGKTQDELGVADQ